MGFLPMQRTGTFASFLSNKRLLVYGDFFKEYIFYFQK
jgi:hypothetical protein